MRTPDPSAPAYIPAPRPPVPSGPMQIPEPRPLPMLRGFLEQMIAEDLQIEPGEDRLATVPRIDWDAIWAAADGAASFEQAIGRVVSAAYVAARDAPRGLREEEVVPERAVVRPADTPIVHPEATAVSMRTFADSAPAPVLDVPLLREATEEIAVQRPDRRVLRRQGLATLFGWIRNIGAIILLFVAWQLWGTSISQHHQQQQLQSAFEASVHAHHAASRPVSSGPVLIAANKVVPPAAEGTAVAQLQIPAIGLSEYVVSGTAEGDLAKGPGHYIGTATPGQEGNVGIAGHRTTNGAPFNRLGQLVVGDPIYLTTLTGERLTYIVSQTPPPVPPNDVAVLDNFGDNRITLTTCNPEYSSAQRLIVVGELKGSPPPAKTKTKPHAYHIVNSQTASWNWSVCPIVILEAGALMLLGLSNRRLSAWYGKVGRWLILTPFWVAGLYLLFQSLATFLPAAV
jgi:sortase A